MELDLFDYSLPRELIAQSPKSPRPSSRLMVVKEDAWEHRIFRDLTGYLGRGDVLVLNDTKVIPARLRGTKRTGGRVEVTLLRERRRGCWRCLARGARLGGSTEIRFADGVEGVLRRENGAFTLTFNRDLESGQVLQLGEAPLPPYIKERIPLERYQTVYAEMQSSVAAPTAGLHFSRAMLRELSMMGVRLAYVTLHIGMGTFAPVRTRDINRHRMEEEYFEVGEECCREIRRGKRVFAVGTTTVKALESACDDGGLRPGSGWSDLFIRPPYEFRSPVDALLTNFHLPRSTLLMLVSAYAGRERILSAYREAVQRGYRFYSFGDAMLIVGGGHV